MSARSMFAMAFGNAFRREAAETLGHVWFEVYRRFYFRCLENLG